MKRGRAVPPWGSMGRVPWPEPSEQSVRPRSHVESIESVNVQNPPEGIMTTAPQQGLEEKQSDKKGTDKHPQCEGRGDDGKREHQAGCRAMQSEAHASEPDRNGSSAKGGSPTLSLIHISEPTRPY